MPAVGPIGLPIETLRSTLSRCYALQNGWQGNNYSEAEALARIHLRGLPKPASGNTHTLDELNDYRPFVEVTTGEEGVTLSHDAAGESNAYHDSGVVVARFEQLVLPTGAGKAEAVQAFDEFIDKLVRSENDAEPGLVELSSVPGEFYAREITVMPAVRVPRRKRRQLGDAIARFVMFEFGSV